jgi:rhodanese-related sulfurtransferase
LKTISPSELQALLEQDPAVAPIDVRTPLEFAEIHIPRARNIPLDQLDPQKLLAAGEVAPQRPAYLVCRTGARAEKAASALQSVGIANSIVLAGGTLGWIDAGLPVNRSAVKVMSLERQVRIAAGSLVFLGVLLGWLVHPGFFGLAGFVGAGLVFAGITDFCGMGLLLARAPWNQLKS